MTTSHDTDTIRQAINVLIETARSTDALFSWLKREIRVWKGSDAVSFVRSLWVAEDHEILGVCVSVLRGLPDACELPERSLARFLFPDDRHALKQIWQDEILRACLFIGFVPFPEL